MEKDKHLGLRIDSETHGKLKSLAEFEGRSINGEVLYLIRQAIAQHEKNHGTSYIGLVSSGVFLCQFKKYQMMILLEESVILYGRYLRYP